MTQVPAKYVAYVTAAAAATGLPYSVVAAQIDLESGFQPGVTSPAGAQGIAQFMPGTWAQYGHGSPFNPPDAFAAYAKYMRALLKTEHGSIRDALAAYNAGPGNLAAGYGYADQILSAAGQPSGAKAGAPPKSNTGPFGIPPGGPWFAYALTGTIQRQSNPVLATALVEAGWVGFAKQSDAKLFIDQSPATSVKSAVKNPVDWLSNIGSFFTKLGEANTWLRIGEVVLGISLVIVGVAKLAAGTQAGQSAMRIGAKAAIL